MRDLRRRRSVQGVQELFLVQALRDERRNVRSVQAVTYPTRPCPGCGRPIPSTWRLCAHCAEGEGVLPAPAVEEGPGWETLWLKWYWVGWLVVWLVWGAATSIEALWLMLTRQWILGGYGWGLLCLLIPAQVASYCLIRLLFYLRQ